MSNQHGRRTVVIGSRLGRPAMGLAALGFALVVARPAYAASVYGFVNANGTLDPGINGGIVAVSQPAVGQYCFSLGFAAKNAVATIDPSTTGNVNIIMTFVPHAGMAGLSGCPAGFNDAAAIIKTTNGVPANAGFYITFQ